MACHNVGSDFSNGVGAYHGQINGNGVNFNGNWTPQNIPIFPSGGGIGSTTGSDGVSDSDNEETSRLPSQSDQRCHSTIKKRRRGIIEKKRRDRINTSLAELKLLIPAAFEKQGSQKLEKAEILQMTVEHLKILQSKGMDAFMYDPQRFAGDYLSMGYRECATEVNRYLSDAGVGVQDPLRMRLMSHLQCYSAQRAAAMASWNTVYNNSGTSQQSWGSSTYGAPGTPINGNATVSGPFLGMTQTSGVSQSAFTPTPSMLKPSSNGTPTQQATSSSITNPMENCAPPLFSSSFLASQFPQLSGSDGKMDIKPWVPASNLSNGTGGLMSR